jgi:hypothetical protein
VDYAGDPIEWLDLKSRQTRKAVVFVGALGFSQLVFAWASEDMKSRNWLSAHQKMFDAFGGVSHVTVPDCLKQGVAKCHLYDPDLNPAYADLAAHFGTAIVPARPSHPKDKAIVEGLVKILMRYFRFRFRARRFTSLAEINQALREACDRINRKPHTRFRISRLERFEKMERPALKPLPAHTYEAVEWKTAKLHPDCHIGVESAYYSVPHIHRVVDLFRALAKNVLQIKTSIISTIQQKIPTFSRNVVHPKYFLEGLSTHQIAEQTASSKRAVLAALRRFEIPLRLQGSYHDWSTHPLVGAVLAKPNPRP